MTLLLHFGFMTAHPPRGILNIVNEHENQNRQHFHRPKLANLIRLWCQQHTAACTRDRHPRTCEDGQPGNRKLRGERLSLKNRHHNRRQPVWSLHLPDGSVCEEWAFFHSQCGPSPGKPITGTDSPEIANPASANCEQKGGKVEIRTAADGSQSGVCVFPNGKECDEWALSKGECAP